MSSQAAVKINQKEYLKKYLSGDKVKKKKKEKKHRRKEPQLKIVDDDLGAGNEELIDEELLLTGDDAPQIVAEYVDDRPAPSMKWKSITIKDEDDAPVIKKEPACDLWGRQSAEKQSRREFSPPLKSSSYSGNIRIKTEKGSVEHNHSIDQSPPRCRERDQSPPRRNDTGKGRSKRNGSSDQSPQKRYDSDQSPPRRRDVKADRRRRNDSSDQSPPRRKNNSHSPPRNKEGRRRRSGSEDQSPPRYSLNQSPPRRKGDKYRNRRSSDQSPPKKLDRSRRWNSSPDQSPPRRRYDDQSPSRRKNITEARQKRNSSCDHSPPRRSTANQSPARKQGKYSTSTNIKRESNSPKRKSRWERRSESSSPPPTHKPKVSKTLDGKKAGLQDAQSLKNELTERRRKEDEIFAKMSSDVTGRDAEVQVRSTGRKGKRARDAEAEDPEVQRRKEAHEAQKKQLYDRWGMGLKQVEDHRTRLAEEQYESSKPLARYTNDEDLDRHLRDQERAEDPMLEYIRKKRKEKEKEDNVPVIPVYEGSYPENRFGIRPGYRWDGVDRSNGYEKKWFDMQNEKRARQDEAYKYSVEDM